MRIVLVLWKTRQQWQEQHHPRLQLITNEEFCSPPPIPPKTHMHTPLHYETQVQSSPVPPAAQQPTWQTQHTLLSCYCHHRMTLLAV